MSPVPPVVGVLVAGTCCKSSPLSPCVSPCVPVVRIVSNDVLVGGKGSKESQFSQLVSPVASVSHPVVPVRRSDGEEVSMLDTSNDDSLPGANFMSVTAKKKVLVSGGLGRDSSKHESGEEDVDRKEIEIVFHTHEETYAEEPPKTQDEFDITGSIDNCENIDDHGDGGGEDLQVWDDAPKTQEEFAIMVVLVIILMGGG